MTKTQCYKCKAVLTEKSSIELFGYTVCKPCKKSLGLLQDQTIKRHLHNFDHTSSSKFDSKSYPEEIEQRLNYIEQYYISSKIKLLHIKERLEHL